MNRPDPACAPQPDAPAAPAEPWRADAGSWGLVGALTAIWGSSFFLIAVALGGFAPLAVSAGRVGCAALALGVALVATGGRLPGGRAAWGWCGALGATGLALPFTLLAWGQQSVTSGIAAISIATTPLFLLALSRFVFGDPIGPRKWAGFAIGLAGIVWLAGPEAARGLGAASTLGLLACLAAALCYAAAAMIVRAMPPVEPLAATAAAHIAAAALLLPFGLAHAPEGLPGLGPVAALASLGVFQTGLAQYLRYVAIRRAGPVFVSVVGYLIPIWAGFLGVAFLDEPLALRTVAAYGLIIGGILIARDRG